jgi:hypothetical protein
MRNETISAEPFAIQASLHVTGEILAIRLRLEAEQIVNHQGATEPLLMRYRGEDFRGREGRVKEESDPGKAAARTQLFGEGNEVVVVHPKRVGVF